MWRSGLGAQTHLPSGGLRRRHGGWFVPLPATSTIAVAVESIITPSDAIAADSSRRVEKEDRLRPASGPDRSSRSTMRSTSAGVTRRPETGNPGRSIGSTVPSLTEIRSRLAHPAAP
jgi:hypothetical protein